MINRGHLLAIVALNLAVGQVLADAKFEQKVERRLAELEATKSQTATEETLLSERAVISGLVKIQAAHGDSPDSRSYSRLDVDTFEIGIALAINEKVDGELVLLYEENETDFGVDVVTLSFSEFIGPVNASVGKQYLPFGAFETALVNDSLILELAETNKTSMVVDSEFHNMVLGGFVFDGDVDRENHVENWGLSFDLLEDSWRLGVDYLSSLAESDGFTGAAEASGLSLEEGAAAMGVSGLWQQQGWVLVGEYLTSFSNMKYNQGVDRVQFKPRALQFELGYSAPIQEREVTFAVAYQKTKGVVGLIPKQRFSLGSSTELYKQVNGGVELWFDKDYRESEGGSGNNYMNVVLQLTAEF